MNQLTSKTELNAPDYVASRLSCEEIRVTGIVQGVGFRPNVWRLAHSIGLTGHVVNDGHGVLIHVWGECYEIDSFVKKLRRQSPPLARIDQIKRRKQKTPNNLSSYQEVPDCFLISSSNANSVETFIAPDAASCPKCLADVNDPFGRRYRYPLTNCTHCGPRFSIVTSIPYDRANTSMDPFIQCESCQSEYDEPNDRRFHAQPNACYDCGPKVELARIDGNPVCLESLTQLDDVDGACTLLQNGHIIVIKGIGGFHLACDATNSETVKLLRERKQRFAKPFALMARDLEVIERYAKISHQEKALLASAEAPIVLLEKTDLPPPGIKREFGIPNGQRAKDLIPISDAVAPGQNALGFMLPYTPLHQLMLKRMNRPIILTSANRSDEPQVIDNAHIQNSLGDIAEYVLWHDREVVNRVDDSVVRVVLDKPRLIRRARAYAPAPHPLPKGFDDIPEILAMGSEAKNTFCLIKNDQAILSQHMGNLENAETYADYQKNLLLYAEIFDHKPQSIAVDAHPEYLSSKLGRTFAEEGSLNLIETQHHHAHIAACLADNHIPLKSEPVLGVALDGLGFGEDGTLWGGEFLKADYVTAQRLGMFKPTAMLGGIRAVHEPWRNTYAHLMAEMSWAELKMNFKELELIQFLEQQPLDTFNAMLKKAVNSPLASSVGRLFDAVAAAIGICRSSVNYEGQAAIELEAIVDQDTLYSEAENLAYPFAIPYLAATGTPYIEPLAMWHAVLGDLILKTPASVMSARFHKGLSIAIVKMVQKLTIEQEERIINTIALTGGVFQNKTLLELVVKRLELNNYQVLTHQHIPANDGGLALGQALIAAAIIKMRK